MENNQKRNYRVVGAPVVKKDAKALVTGKPVYTDDLALKDCLIVKVLRSPYAHALITEIDCAVAAKMPGIECILTWKDVPQKRFTMAGQTGVCGLWGTRLPLWPVWMRRQWTMPCV